MAAGGLAVRPEPGWLLIAESVGCEHEQVRLRGLLQVQVCCPVNLDHSDIPAFGVDAMHLSRGLVGARFRRVTAAIGAAAERSAKLVKNATLKVYAGAPHGLAYTHKEQLNADLLAFLKA